MVWAVLLCPQAQTAPVGSPLASAASPTVAPTRAPNRQPSAIPAAGGEASASASSDTTLLPEEEDYSPNAYSEFGSFHQDEEEIAVTSFLKYGRFYGISLGLGFEYVDGNRGALWQGGFPMFDFKLHYWFDFNIGMDINLYTSQQYYNTAVESYGHVDVNMMRIGLDFKYYINVHDLSSAITFANPYLFLGVGSFTKTENSTGDGTQLTDTSIAASWGGGFEFAIQPRTLYFILEGRMTTVTFQDTYTTIYQGQVPNLPSLTGFFYNASWSLLLTW